eukprot:TRINITY_DN15263_c0_g5_i1.p1 TRINITY_DN15263_c0_g5~~TRINITY_DN15263_c0_g5_i1.p1  ORF type:complete len:277 (+),score=29.72 TRINITY_DN15263_c0_g5_i1:135-965(+)
MGASGFKDRKSPASTQHSPVVPIIKASFEFHHMIGRGGFSKVWKVSRRKDNALFALKEMAKARILAKRSVNSVMNERMILSQLRHPFIVNMNCAFVDRESLYLVMDYLDGGDLRFHLARQKKFCEAETSSFPFVILEFMAACIISALEYIHNNGIIHRDVKPENLIFDSRGYLKVSDFGIARIWNPNNAHETSGTPGYMGKVECESSARGDVQEQLRGGSGLLCSGSDCVRVHDGKKTVPRQNTQRNPRRNALQTSANKEGRGASELVIGGSFFCQ